MKITCNCKTTMSIGDLEEFQQGIKTITDKNLDKLIRSIETNGFNVPFIVWGNKIMDGHQRLKALQKKGYTGEVPVISIDAENENHAKEILLNITSQHGVFAIEELQDFTKGLLDLDSVSLVDGPHIDLNFKVDLTPKSEPVIDNIEVVDPEEYEQAEVEEVKLETLEEIDFPDGGKFIVGEDRYFAEEVVRMWNNRNKTQKIEFKKVVG